MKINMEIFNIVIKDLLYNYKNINKNNLINLLNVQYVMINVLNFNNVINVIKYVVIYVLYNISKKREKNLVQTVIPYIRRNKL